MFKVFDSLSSHKQLSEVNFVEKTINLIHLTDTFPKYLCFAITGGQENRMMPEEARKKTTWESIGITFIDKKRQTHCRWKKWTFSAIIRTDYSDWLN